MAMPTWDQLLQPLLELAADGKEHSVREAIAMIADRLNLTPEERSELLPSGRQPRFENRVGWSSTALRKAGLLEATRRGYFRITTSGTALVQSNPAQLTKEGLLEYPGYAEFKQFTRSSEQVVRQGGAAESAATPTERLTSAYAEINQQMEDDLLEKVRKMSPDFFERLVVDLLNRMGYGGSLRDAAQAIGRTGDGGVDGVIKEDALGLDKIYIQAKRYTTNNVPARDIRDFKGALDDKNARKGVFLTTSGFANDAIESAAKTAGKSIVLIDGKTLAKLMLEHGVGISVIETYAIRRIDEDFFESEEPV